MGLSILIGIIGIIGVVLCVVWGIACYNIDIEAVFVGIFFGTVSIIAFLILSTGYVDNLQAKIRIDDKTTRIETTKSLIKDIDSSLYDNNGKIIDTVNMNKLSKMVDLKSSLATQIVDLKACIRRCNFKCDHKFIYIFPFKKSDFNEYNDFLFSFNY